MILRLKIKNLQCIFTGKSDRAVVHPELQPHKQWYFTYIASVLIQIYLLGKISVTCQGKIPMPNLITFSLLMLHSTTSRRTICPLITVRFKFIALNLMWIVTLCYVVLPSLQIFFLLWLFHGNKSLVYPKYSLHI